MKLGIGELKICGEGPDSSRSNLPELYLSSNDNLIKSDSAFKSTLLNLKEEQFNINDNEDNNPQQNSSISPTKKKPKSQKKKMLQFLSQEKVKTGKKELNFITKKLEFKKEEPKKKERTDNFGDIINKQNKKKIKICFIDEVDNNQNLVTEIKIESFKTYNLILGLPKNDYYGGENKKKNECSCCNII